jgi:predicted RNase H-like HicB family nuclease
MNTNRKTMSFVVWKEGEEFVAQCLNVDIASQGNTIDEAIKNLKEAVELFLQDENSFVMPEIESIFLGKEEINV